jgi:hypothetical protein
MLLIYDDDMYPRNRIVITCGTNQNWPNGGSVGFC